MIPSPPQSVDDDPFCPAQLGPAPHNYVYQADIFTGKTLLYCVQCGDVLEIGTFTPITNPLGVPTQPANAPSAPAQKPGANLFP
jgi:hypothetical protein